MKIADGYVLKNIAGTNVVVPLVSNNVTFRAIITLNESGAFLWSKLSEETSEEELLAEMLKEYDIDEKTAREDIAEFLETLRKAELLR